MVSNAIGMFAGIDQVGLPEMFHGQSYALQYHCRSRPPTRAGEAAAEDEQRQDRPLDAHRRVDAVHRERAVAVELGVAGVADLAGGLDQLAGRVVLGEVAVELAVAVGRCVVGGLVVVDIRGVLAFDSVVLRRRGPRAIAPLTSAIAITGRKRKNRRNSVKNRPIVPTNRPMS